MATRLRTRNCRQGWTTLNRGKIMTATNILKTFTLFLNTETDMRKISTTAISITILLAVSTELTSCEDTDSSSEKKNNYLEMGDARMPLYSAYTECGFWPYDPYIYYDICLLLTDVEEFDDSYYVYFEINLQGEDIEDIYFDETFTEENLLDRFGMPSGTYELGSFELPGLSIDTENQVIAGGVEYGGYWSYNATSGHLTIKHIHRNEYQFSFNGTLENGEAVKFNYQEALNVLYD